MSRPSDSGRSIRDDGIVCCAVGDYQYALRGADVRQILRVEEMQAEPGPDRRVGTLAVAGRTIPVFELGRVLGHADWADHPPRGRHIAVTGAGGELTGWLVDHLARTQTSHDMVAVPLPPILGPVATTWFEALVRVGDRSVLLLAPQYLSPVVHRTLGAGVEADATAAFHVPAPSRPHQSEPMAVIFSTPALPRCEASSYALSGRQIAAVVQPQPQIVVPGSAAHVTGVMWWRNAVVPVIDFRAESDRDRTAPRARFIIAQCGAQLAGTLVAFAIDSEITLHRPARHDLEMSGVPRPAFAAGMFDLRGEVVALVDLDALLGGTQ